MRSPLDVIAEIPHMTVGELPVTKISGGRSTTFRSHCPFCMWEGLVQVSRSVAHRQGMEHLVMAQEFESRHGKFYNWGGKGHRKH